MQQNSGGQTFQGRHSRISNTHTYVYTGLSMKLAQTACQYTRHSLRSLVGT